jgi:hypothetical protein
MYSARLGEFVALPRGTVAHGPASMPGRGGVHVMARPMNPTVGGHEWLVLLSPDNRRTMTTREVQAEVQAGRLSSDTFVWQAGMSAWAPIGSIAELAMPNVRPTAPQAQPSIGWDVPLAQRLRPNSPHDDPRQFSPPTTLRPQLVLELVATGAAVLLIVLGTSYSLYVGGAFQPGNAVQDGLHTAGAQAKTAAH